MPSIDFLRSQLGDDAVGRTDEDILSAFARATGVSNADAALQFGYDPGRGSLTRERLSASADSYQAGLYGVGEAVTKAIGLDRASSWMGERRRANEFQAESAQATAHQLGGIDSWDKVNGFGDAANWIGGLAAQSAPYALEALAGGVVARGLSTGLRAAVNSGRAAGTVEGLEAARAASSSLATRSMIGGTVASYPSAVGDILQNQREESGGATDLLSAATLGVGYAAANNLGMGGALARGGLGRAAISAFDGMQGIRGGLARMGTSMLRNGLEEAAGETIQEGFNQGGRMAVNPDATLFSDAAMERYKDSALGGFALGSVFGGPGGWRRSEAYYDKQYQTGLANMRAREAADLQARQPMDLLQANQGGLPGIDAPGAHSILPQFADSKFDPAMVQEALNQRSALENELRRTEAAGDMQGFYAARSALADLNAKVGPAIEQFERQQAAAAQPGQMGLFGSGESVVPPTAQPQRLDTQIVDPAGTVATTEADVAALSDPGAVLARERYLQQKRDAEALAERQQAIKAEQARMEQVKQRAAGFGLKGKLAVELFDALEQKYGTNGTQNQEAFDEQINNLAMRANGKVRQHLGLNADGSKQNVSQQNVSGTQPVGSSAAGGANAQGSMAAPGRDSAAGGGVGADATGAGSTGGKVDVQPGGDQRPAVTPYAQMSREQRRAAAKEAWDYEHEGTTAPKFDELHPETQDILLRPQGVTEQSIAVARKKEAELRRKDLKVQRGGMEVVSTDDTGEQTLKLRMGDKEMTLKGRFVSRLAAVAGFNADGTWSGKTRSAEEAAEFLNAQAGGDGSKTQVTRDDINNTLRQRGLSVKQIEQRMGSGDESWLSRYVVGDGAEDTTADLSDNTAFAATTEGAGEDGGPTGLRVAKNAADVNGDHFEDSETAAQKKVRAEATKMLDKEETSSEDGPAVSPEDAAMLAARNERGMAARRYMALNSQSEQARVARIQAETDWNDNYEDGEVPVPFDSLTTGQKAEYYVAYMGLLNEEEAGGISGSQFVEATLDAQLETLQKDDYAITDPRGSGETATDRAQLGGPSAGEQPGNAGRDSVGQRAAQKTDRRAQGNGDVQDVEPKASGVKFSKAAKSGPVSVSVTVGDKEVTFADAKAALDRLESKIARHESLLACLRRAG